MVDTVVERTQADPTSLAERDRTYDEAMDAWRTSCPKLPVWEDANDRGLIVREDRNGRSIMRVTQSGLVLLARRKGRSETCPT